MRLMGLGHWYDNRTGTTFIFGIFAVKHLSALFLGVAKRRRRLVSLLVAFVAHFGPLLIIFFFGLHPAVLMVHLLNLVTFVLDLLCPLNVV